MPGPLMRHTTLLIALIVLPASLAAQQRRGGTGGGQPPAAHPATPATPGVNTSAGDRYGHPIYLRAPLISMDSAVQMTEARYAGWFVDSKVFTRERYRPIYVFRMITGGMTGTRELWVDGDTGLPINPEVMGDTTNYRRRPRYPTAPTYP